jgi:tetratricopeptide (TPR) repeat protein
MSARLPRLRRLAPAAIMAVAALLIVPVQNRLDAGLPHSSVDPDLLYFSSPPAVKALALGYDGLLADIYWMRAIQYYGRRDEAQRRQIPYKNLAALLDIVTTLDPGMIDVYRTGSVFLAEPEPVGAGQPQKALELLDKGIAAHPRDWRLPFDKGFVHFWYTRDYREAGRAWLQASRIEGAPDWLAALAARGLSQGGAIEVARELWRRQLESAGRADLKENARNHLASIQVDEDLWTLEYLVEKYAALRGALPRSLAALVAAGWIRTVPKDPSGVPYAYDPSIGAVSLSSASKVKYIALPYDYRDPFKARLARLLTPQGK